MAIITLTDRISVRVTAKDSAESSNQKKRDGGNVASALGGSGLSDSEKEELGESLGETVTDESGKTYARSDKVAGVLKQIAAAGKLSSKHNEGITTGSTIYTVNPLLPAPEVFETDAFYNNRPNGIFRLEILSGSPMMAWNKPANSSGATSYSAYFYSKESYTWRAGYYNSDGSIHGDPPRISTAEARSRTLGNTKYSYFGGGGINYNDQIDQYGGGNINPRGASYIETTYSYSGSYEMCVVGAMFGVQSGGPPLDPTDKTDDQIQKDIEDFAALNNCKMTSDSGDTYIAVTDANGNPLYFLGT